MQLQSYDQITPQFLENYRKDKDLSLAIFWEAVGCSRSRGLRYENQKVKLPETVKRLVFLHYGVGIPTDCQSEEFHEFVEAFKSSGAPAAVKAAKLIEQAHSLLTEAAQ